MRIYSARAGFAVDMPAGWWCRIWDRIASAPDDPVAPAIHAANFSLPVEDGSFGFAATVPAMGRGDIFFSLVELGGPEMAYQGIYGPTTLPDSFDLGDFDGSWLTSPTTKLFGLQYFCTLSDRPCCLFLVIGGETTLLSSRAEVVGILSTIEVTSAAELDRV